MSLLSRARDPLPSWNEAPAKEAVIDFVNRVTATGSTDFLQPKDRIAVFDCDGTLCSEIPVFIQHAFTVDRTRAPAQARPGLTQISPFREIPAGGPGASARVLAKICAGMTAEEFENEVRTWMATARHPKTGLRYTEMAFLPMIELIEFLQTNRFRVYIVSAGGIDFLRSWTEEVFGIPREQVIGSGCRLKYEERDHRPVLVRLPELELSYDDGEKPAAMYHVTGRRPVLAFGNADDDLPMLRWVASGPGPFFAGLIRHTDAHRESAYGTKDTDLPGMTAGHALSEAQERGWTVVDMKNDWRTIFRPGQEDEAER